MAFSIITGIDIGQYSIKAATIKQSENRFILLGCKDLTLSNILPENGSRDHQEIVNKLKELKKQLPLFCRGVAISLPDSKVTSKTILLDKRLDYREKVRSIRKSLIQSSLMSDEEVCLDFVPLAEPDDSGNALYQTCAAKAETVAEYSGYAKHAGLTPLFLDSCSHSLLQVLQLQQSTQADNSGSLLAFSDGTQLMICGYLAGQIFSQSMRMTNGLMHEQEHKSELLQFLFRQLQLSRSMEQHRSVKQLWFAGSEIYSPDFVSWLSEQLMLEVKRIDPASFLTIKRSEICSGMGVFSTAIGIAVRAHLWKERTNDSIN